MVLKRSEPISQTQHFHLCQTPLRLSASTAGAESLHGSNSAGDYRSHRGNARPPARSLPPPGCRRPRGGTAPRGKLGARRVSGGAFGRQTHLSALKLGWSTAAAETPARGQVDAQGGTVAPLASTCPEVPASRQGRGALARPLRCLRPGDTAVSAPRALLKSLPKSGLGANWDGMGPPSSRGRTPFGGALACSTPAWGDSWSSCQRLQPPGLSFLPLPAPR